MSRTSQNPYDFESRNSSMTNTLRISSPNGQIPASDLRMFCSDGPNKGTNIVKVPQDIQMKHEHQQCNSRTNSKSQTKQPFNLAKRLPDNHIWGSLSALAIIRTTVATCKPHDLKGSNYFFVLICYLNYVLVCRSFQLVISRWITKIKIFFDGFSSRKFLENLVIKKEVPQNLIN